MSGLRLIGGPRDGVTLTLKDDRTYTTIHTVDGTWRPATYVTVQRHWWNRKTVVMLSPGHYEHTEHLYDAHTGEYKGPA